jgi:hypothetical protein
MAAKRKGKNRVSEEYPVRQGIRHTREGAIDADDASDMQWEPASPTLSSRFYRSKEKASPCQAGWRKKVGGKGSAKGETGMDRELLVIYGSFSK